MLNQAMVSGVLARACAQGADFAELYFEDGESVAISYLRRVTDLSRTSTCGVGLYLIKGLQSVYVYGNDLSESGLRTLCDRGCALLRAKARGIVTVPAFRQVEVAEPNPVEVRPITVSPNEKIALLANADRALRGMGSDVVRVDLAYNEGEKVVTIANSEGVWAEDHRTTVRLRATPTVAGPNDSVGHFVEFTRPQGFEAFRDGSYIEHLKAAVVDMREQLTAEEAPNGYFPVILAPGGCSGTFFHECCGHQLETNYDPTIQYDLLNNGIFHGKLGTRVGSEKVTVIDDGTLPGMYGSSKFDDEGMPRQRNVLIENGILKSYLVNRMGSLKLGVPRNGSARRQNYTQAPAARMSNTYLAPGTDSLDEMIRSMPEGLYVTRMGGGQGGADFMIVASGYWIKNGQIHHRVKNAPLMGRGDQTMHKIDRVGGDLQWERSGSFCGGASGLCNVTTSGASLRISELLVGGKGGKR